MLYEILKAVHIVAVIVWLAGMTAVALGLLRPNPELLKFLKSYDRKITTPAMLLVWIAGISLAIQGEWFGSGWLWAKIILVTIMSGLHGAITGRLRRYRKETSPAPAPEAKAFLLAGFTVLVGVVLLVTTKVI